jgi:nucleoside-diphosphate-sugar epimerase
MTRVLVTGGAGYVGSTLVPLLLERGFQVRVLDSLMHGGESLLGVWAHPAFEFRRGDVRDRSAVRAALAEVDAVVHLAAIVGDPACARDPELSKAVNLDASLALLADCRAAGVARLVFASTCSNYGKMADAEGYVDETSPLSPVSLYAETKVAMERALLDPSGTTGICATPLRFATVFGVSPRMRFDLTVNEFTAELITRRRLKVFGEQFWRPYVHVRDAARAVVTVLEAPESRVRGEVFNVGATDQNYQKQQLVELIRPHATDAVVEYVHKAEDPRDYRVAFSKIADQLGFGVTRSVPQGIAEVAHLVSASTVADWTEARYRN